MHTRTYMTYARAVAIAALVLPTTPSHAQPEEGRPGGCTFGEIIDNAPPECKDESGDLCDQVTVLDILDGSQSYVIDDPGDIEHHRTRYRVLDAWCAYVENCAHMPPPRIYVHEQETIEEICWQVKITC